MKHAYCNDFALVSLIAQHVVAQGRAVRVADVARWLGISKPTARERLAVLVERGLVGEIRKPYRRNATVHEFNLTPGTRARYENGAFRNDYENYVHDRIAILRRELS